MDIRSRIAILLMPLFLLSVVWFSVPLSAADPVCKHPPGGTVCVKSRVHIRYLSRRDRFRGFLVSDSNKRTCQRDRIVSVRRVRNGHGVTVTTAVTDKNGHWRSEIASYPTGHYFAVALKETHSSGVDRRVICLRARSRTISVQRR
ncbi:MAG: hypothetical protein QOC87_617 [Actinomycetota bacterium]|jgi:hypothetical protein|nr:hypothetical protein [Actinomycetota bacterium]